MYYNLPGRVLGAVVVRKGRFGRDAECPSGHIIAHMSERRTYSEKLKDPRWQKRRLERFQAAEFRCQDCDCAEKTLHVHHRYYISKREPWEYPDFALRVLCEDCHSIWHELQAEGHLSLYDWEWLLDCFSGEYEWDLLHCDLGYALAVAEDRGLSRMECIRAACRAIKELEGVPA